MILYRIAREKYARDLSGYGGLLSSARWHDHVQVIYTSLNSSTCILEKLVHLEPIEIHHDLMMVTLTVPDETLMEVLAAKQLPPGWNTYPAPPVLKRIGNAWLKSGTSAFLNVPSAIDMLAQNVLINPRHADSGSIVIEDVAPFTYDTRLLIRGKKLTN